MKIFIYILRDPTTNLVRYVGKSIQPTIRYSRHLNNAKRPKRHVECWINGLLTHGLLPKMEVVVETTLEKWEEVEKEWIKFYKEQTNNNITNTAEGGVGDFNLYEDVDTKINRLSKLELARKTRIFTQEERWFMALRAIQTHTGRKRSVETKHRLSIAKIGALNPQFGKHPSLETRKKLSLANLGKKKSLETIEKFKLAASKRRRGILQLTQDDKLLNAWTSIKYASEITQIQRSNIIACCRGRLKTAGGYKWSYKV